MIILHGVPGTVFHFFFQNYYMTNSCFINYLHCEFFFFTKMHQIEYHNIMGVPIFK